MRVTAYFSPHAVQVPDAPPNAVFAHTHWAVDRFIARSYPWNCPEVDTDMTDSDGDLVFKVDHTQETFSVPFDTEVLLSLCEHMCTFFAGVSLRTFAGSIEEYAGVVPFHGLMTCKIAESFHSPAAVRMLASDFREVANMKTENRTFLENEFLDFLSPFKMNPELELWIQLRDNMLKTARRGGLLTIY